MDTSSKSLLNDFEKMSIKELTDLKSKIDDILHQKQVKVIINKVTKEFAKNHSGTPWKDVIVGGWDYSQSELAKDEVGIMQFECYFTVKDIFVAFEYTYEYSQGDGTRSYSINLSKIIGKRRVKSQKLCKNIPNEDIRFMSMLANEFYSLESNDEIDGFFDETFVNDGFFDEWMRLEMK